MRIVVTGSRTWRDAELLECVLDNYLPCDMHVGDCPTGADAMALAWAEQKAYQWMRYVADWDTRGKAAGPFRNREMLELANPELVVAFRQGTESRGTDDCIKAARGYGIPVLLIQHDGVRVASRGAP